MPIAVVSTLLLVTAVIIVSDIIDVHRLSVLLGHGTVFVTTHGAARECADRGRPINAHLVVGWGRLKHRSHWCNLVGSNCQRGGEGARLGGRLLDFLLLGCEDLLLHLWVQDRCHRGSR